MDIQEFSKKLDEILEAEDELLEKQQLLGVVADNEKDSKNTMLFFDTETFVNFAKLKGLDIEVQIERFDYINNHPLIDIKIEPYCRLIIQYKKRELRHLLSEKEYSSFQERGLLP